MSGSYGGSPYGSGTYGGGSPVPPVPAAVEVRQPSYALNLAMYNFIIAEIRDRDQREGFEFLRRYLLGPQRVWDDIVEKFEKIPDIWSITDCPDELLQYLKWIVGWTSERELKKITDVLTAKALRRLIAISGPMWNQRGPEDVILSVLSALAQGARARIWNWFDFRWVLDETELGEEHQGRDPWIINLPAAVVGELLIDSGVGASSVDSGVTITLSGDTFSTEVALDHRFRLTSGVWSGQSGLVKTRDSSTQITLQGTGIPGGNFSASDWEVVDEEWAPTDDRLSNLRIMDVGPLDRTLVKRILRLMRASGERFEINYLLLLDLFNVEGDFLQWVYPIGEDLLVEDGMLRLVDDTQDESTVSNVAGAPSWSQYVAAARFKGGSTSVGAEFGMMFYWTGGDNHYKLVVDTATPALLLYKVVGGTPTLIKSVNLAAAAINLLPGIFYTYRVSIVQEGAQNRIQVFIDGAELMSELDGALNGGNVGFLHGVDATIEIDDVEIFALPADTDTLGINEFP